MLKPRVIPCLLVHGGGLVKTVSFGSPKYVGDPINVVRILNEKQVDELTIFDIDATVVGREPDFRLIERLAAESRMPVCYGGGVSNREFAKRIIALGVEKVALSAAAIKNPSLLSNIASDVGSQSVVGVIDFRRDSGGRLSVWVHNGCDYTGHEVLEIALAFEQAGVGEIVLNSIDRDGKMSGYDLDAVGAVRGAVRIPLTVVGGAGSLDDIAALIDRFPLIGAGAGSLFMFKGPYKAVLVNYPTPAQKDAIFSGQHIPSGRSTHGRSYK
ncbi:AglZ/HisF2 family acetamidino modification protein [Pseudolabrys sp.]|uniref:AglZ/HisF2 family acetamidino modification protein n=1 Tax=Pseudolabrys sp. TaxID=1960880 RepID=UPI003D1406C8